MLDLQLVIAELDRVVAAQMAVDRTPGLSLAITDRERTLHVGVHGLADIATGEQVTPDTRFEIGSIGKSLAADVVLALAAEGRIDLHAPVTAYLPWFEIRSEFAPITVHHLLNHSAGISSGLDGTADAVTEALALAGVGAGTPPGDRVHYSNAGYKLVGLVIAAVTGRSSSEAIAERIVGPLGMTTASSTITHADRLGMSTGYVGLYDDKPFHPSHPLVPATWLETDTADGAVAATATDMAAYTRLLLNRGAFPGGRVYPESSFERKITSGTADEDGDLYGYGINHLQIDGHSVVGHPGGMVGFSAGLVADLNAGLGVAAFVNGPGSPNRIAFHALALVRAAQEGRPLPPAPDLAPDDPAPFADAYRHDGGSAGSDVAELVFASSDGILRLRHDGVDLPLHPYGDDAFVSDHPEFDRFAFQFERDASDAVVAVSHGGFWFGVAGAVVDPVPPYPPEWDAYPGHYRSFSPWCSNFRVVLRRGELRLIFPEGPDGFEDDQPLVSVDAPGQFRAGSDPGCPERIAFSTVIDGRAQVATLSGSVYGRFFTP